MPEARYTLTRASDGARTELRDTTVVGRANDCGLVIKEGLASRTHAILTIEAGALWIENQSRNGTSVNGSQLTAREDAPSRRQDMFRDGGVCRLRSPAGTSCRRRNDPEATGGRQTGGSWRQPTGSPGLGTHSSSKTEFIDRAALIGSTGTHRIADLPTEVDVPTLVVMSGKRTGSRIELNKGAQSGAQWTVGSDASQAIVLSDPGVSALHAAIVSEGHDGRSLTRCRPMGPLVDGKHTPKSYLSRYLHQVWPGGVPFPVAEIRRACRCEKPLRRQRRQAVVG